MTEPTRRRFFQLPLPWRSAARIQSDVDEELRFEIDMRTAELVAEGMSDAEARRRATAEFGDFEGTRRYCAGVDRQSARAERRADWLAELAQDARLAWRGARRRPAFSAIVVTTLALGIGANTAVFSVVRKALLDRLPYAHPDQLVRLYTGPAQAPHPQGMFAPAEIRDFERSRSFSEVAAFGDYEGYTYVGPESADIWATVRVSPTYFHLLGVHALLGRTLDARDVASDATSTVLLSYGLWQRTFGGDSAIIGRTIRLNGAPRTVVGVMPATFISPDRNPDVWFVLDLRGFPDGSADANRTRIFRVLGRLAPGRPRSELEAMLGVLARRAQARSGASTPLRFAAVPLRDDMVGTVRPVLLVVMGAAALVLLLACVNVAGLFLSRATARQRELAVRAALGAGRARLIRQLLTESLGLALVGGAIGVTLALRGTQLLAHMAALQLPSAGDARVDGGVLAFAALVSVASALAFGLLPALAGTHVDLRGSLAESSRGGSTGRGSARIGRALVGAQVALAVVLLAGAALLGRTLVTLEHIGTGFDVSRHTLAFAVNLSSPAYQNPARQMTFFDELVGAVRKLPGVRTVGMAGIAPWNGPNGISFMIDGRPQPAAGAEPTAHYDFASDDYFAALGIPVRRGRAFTTADRMGTPPVALVSESVARKYWPGESPLGQRIRLGDGTTPWHEIVGVVADVRESPSEDVLPMIYTAFDQSPPGGGWIIVRTSGNAVALAPAVRRIVHDVDATLPLIHMRTMHDIFADLIAAQRIPMLLTSAFALLALLLAVLGVYSIMAYSVAAREREFGIRAALGARRGDVLALVFRQGMVTAAIGTVAGLAAAAALTRVLASLLVSVSAHDPLTFVLVPLLLVAVSAAACLVPARRATRVDPTEALRAD